MSLASEGLSQFSGKRILLLQGPVGPFFHRLSRKLASVGASVHKVNFNSGDWIFFPNADLNYRGTLEDWPKVFERIINDLKIDFVLLFGDCRPIHRTVIPLAIQSGRRVGVFEEGYVRPLYVTFEEFGVNANSRMNLMQSIDSGNDLYNPRPVHFNSTFYVMAAQAFIYFSALSIGQKIFPNYKHHRNSGIFEAFCWIRSFYRKIYYRIKERNIESKYVFGNSGNYFLVPLQNHIDSQIFCHSDWKNIEAFIKTVIKSFAKHAPSETSLIFKHHPMDRGHRDYSSLISEIGSREGVKQRVIYVHDLSLPNLLNNARGVVLVNSSIGISSLMRNLPVKVMGRAFFDLGKLTYQHSLDSFWEDALKFSLDERLVRSYINKLIYETQVNGSFYKNILDFRNYKN